MEIQIALLLLLLFIKAEWIFRDSIKGNRESYVEPVVSVDSRLLSGRGPNYGNSYPNHALLTARSVLCCWCFVSASRTKTISGSTRWLTELPARIFNSLM